MAKIQVLGLTIAAVFVIAEIKVGRGEPAEGALAIGALRAVASAQRAYAALNGGYATSLKMLAAPCSGGQQGFISPNLSSDPTVTRGYEIRLQADAHALTGRVDCHGNPTARAYYATAVPLQRTRTTIRAFAVDQNGVLWYDATGAAPKPPFSETAALKRLQ
jgi:hypothetical protein